MKIVGIGNAIVDIFCKVNNEFLKKYSLNKGTMKLINAKELKKLLSLLTIEKTISGGSVANSIVGLSQLGTKVGFIGKINNDIFGKKYEQGLKKEKVNYLYSKKKENIATGTCLILITPDSERTMCTFLGISGKINKNDINPNILKNSEIVFLEGYLWDEGEAKGAFDKAIINSNKVAMSLSDLLCVERHKKNFIELAKNKLDLIFANEQEILSLTDSKSVKEVIAFAKQINKTVVITRGAKGSMSINNNEVIECKAKKVSKIIDLTGAGDMFAAGYLHGYINKLSNKQCLQKGTDLSSKIIQQIGARF